MDVAGTGEVSSRRDGSTTNAEAAGTVQSRLWANYEWRILRGCLNSERTSVGGSSGDFRGSLKTYDLSKTKDVRTPGSLHLRIIAADDTRAQVLRLNVEPLGR